MIECSASFRHRDVVGSGVPFRHYVRWIAAWLLALTAVPAAGQDGASTVDPAIRARRELTIQAVRLDAPLRLDGVLDEPLYTAAPPVTGFLQTEPDEG
jgi:hypothetical protein